MKIKNIFLIILRIVTFIIVFMIINNILCFFLNPDFSFSRYTLHDLYTKKENIDTLIVGSCHTYYEFDPSIINEKNNISCFCLGTSEQRYDGTYTLIREACKNNKIDTIYLEMYFGVAGKDYKMDKHSEETYIIGDYMKPSWNKYSYLVNSCSKEYYLYSLIPASRYKNNLFDKEKLEEIIEMKCNNKYLHYYDSRYLGDGYVKLDGNVAEGIIECSDKYKSILNPIFSSDDVYYINKIIEYCEENNIKLVAFSSPMPDYNLIQRNNYDEYICQVSELFDKYSICYYDFNLLKSDYFDFDSKYFADDEHLNYEGTIQFTNIFYRYFYGDLKNKDIFYKSYKEKIDSIENKEYGISYSINESEGRTLTVNNITTYKSSNMKIVVNTENLKKEYSTNSKSISIELPNDDECLVDVECYMEDSSTLLGKYNIDIN